MCSLNILREIFVTDLVKHALGPRDGLNEPMTASPFSEYITGILSPQFNDPGSDSLLNLDNSEEFESYGTSSTPDDDSVGYNRDFIPLMSPVLDPKHIPRSMGITFHIKNTKNLKLDICLTWARYKKSSNKWIRTPKSFIAALKNFNDKVIFINSDGKKCSKTDLPEISLHIKAYAVNDVSMSVSLYVVNQLRSNDRQRHNSSNYVFQPQIRIVCTNAVLIPSLESKSHRSNVAYEHDALLYKNRPSYARGHMTSAIWKKIDPEIIPSKTNLDHEKCLKMPGFYWIDGDLLNSTQRKKFSQCDLRTEFIPIYSVPASDLDISDMGLPIFSSEQLAETWLPEEIHKIFDPLLEKYANWINELITKMKDSDISDTLKSQILDRANNVQKRIKKGIDLLCNDPEARLSFCFANKAMSVQSKWHGRDSDIKFRPFQIAFVLMSLESTLRTTSDDRQVCDLLWIPTGGGKTETYLLLVSIVVAYRRIRKLEESQSSDGVSVISRYTLRLLTIQQFRRTVSLFTALEFLRIYNLKNKKSVGWRPKNYADNKNFLWGTTQFSIGLWMGEATTPNKLANTGTPNSNQFGYKPGALSILKTPEIAKNYSDPAQIIQCPSCQTFLSIPDHAISTEALHFVIYSTTKLTSELINKIWANDPNANAVLLYQHEAKNFYTISFLTKNRTLNNNDVNLFWKRFEQKSRSNKINIELSSTSASTPGYFFRTYVNENHTLTEYDFEIFCPNPKCTLKTPWTSGSPLGRTHGRVPDPHIGMDNAFGIKCNVDHKFKDVISPFQINQSVSDRIPIPAFTVDDQIYSNLPTMVLSTVDKIARLPFLPKAASIFGHVNFYHVIKGYYRFMGCKDPKDPDACDKHEEPYGRTVKNFNSLDNVAPLPPDLIIQDELHLIDGPLGSMYGIYETLVDKLCLNKAKYIASTATIKNAHIHVKAAFARNELIFPPIGISADDRFFTMDQESHALYDEKPGRLYVGICAPGRGALTPLVRIWSRIAQTGHDNRSSDKIDNFWTVTGYFNTLRELAACRSLYRQDIKEAVRHLSPNDPRSLPDHDDDLVELSSRTPSTQLPSMLDKLNYTYAENRSKAVDALLTTSMFGTGIDISRIGAMIISGQTKTTASYIQATGRVGRKHGAIVIVFYRASRPRDLSHYEFFIRNHRQLHRSVEPSTIFPFAQGILENSLGPVMVGILRNHCANTLNDLALDPHLSEPLATKIKTLMNKTFKEKLDHQPEYRKISPTSIYDDISSKIRAWEELSHSCLKYEHRAKNTCNNIILGNSMTRNNKEFNALCEITPNSLRNIEDEVGFAD